jgi:hypothetical protein
VSKINIGPGEVAGKVAGAIHVCGDHL